MEIRRGRMRLKDAHIIPHINLRRLKDRAKPQRVHAQMLQIIELRYDPVDITDPIAVGVAERGGVYLVDDCLLPPHTSRLGFRCRGHDGSQQVAVRWVRCLIPAISPRDVQLCRIDLV